MNHNFVHLEYPLTHPGVDRAEKVVIDNLIHFFHVLLLIIVRFGEKD